MRSFVSRINVESPEYIANRESMTVLLEQLSKRLKESQWQGPQRHVERYKKEGRLLARERIELLLDDDTPFLEICPLAGLGQGGDAHSF